MNLVTAYIDVNLVIRLFATLSNQDSPLNQTNYALDNRLTFKPFLIPIQ